MHAPEPSPAKIALTKARALTVDSTVDEIRAAKNAIDHAIDARVRASVRAYGVTADTALAKYLGSGEGESLAEAVMMVAHDLDFVSSIAAHDRHVAELANVW